jgi:hypothetical protein
MKTYIHLWYATKFLLEWEMFQTKYVEKTKTHFMFNNFFTKVLPLQDNVDKYGRVKTGHRWQYNMACALCKLDN